MVIWAVAAGAAVVVVVLALLLRLGPAAGTPELPADVEALRSEASTYEMARPVHAEGWSLVLTAANSHKVWVRFEREEADAVEIGIDVGSSAQVADCTITVLESHPARWDNAPGAVSGSALLAVQCPDGGRQRSPGGGGTALDR